MKRNLMWTVTSMLSVVLFALHWADDIVRGMSPGGVSGLFGVLILVVWLYGTLVLGERRSGYIIVLLGSLGGLGVLVIHMRGAGLAGGKIANSSGAFLFRVDAAGAGRDGDVFGDPIGAGIVEDARGTAGTRILIGPSASTSFRYASIHDSVYHMHNTARLGGI